MFVNKSPRYEILSEESLAVLDRGWRRIVSELGIEFTMPEAVELFAAAGMKTEGDNVWLDPDFVMEQVAKAPHQFDVHARNPANNVTIGGDNMVFGSVYGPPFVREGDVRRVATMNDFEQFCKLSQSFPQLDSAGGTICEPDDAPLDSRHLDMVRALVTLTDKFFMGSVTSAANASRHPRDGRHRVRRPREHRARPGDDLADQRQLAAALRRAHARCDVRVRARRPARAADAVPADGRHVARVRCRRRSRSRWPRRSPASRWCS